MIASRPDPDQLLGRLKREETAATRGRLKIFFGAAAGVGKTYQMLETAQARLRAGGEVVVGWVETHGRVETARLLEGLEILPAHKLEHRDTEILEFDLDAALRRKPALLLVDELAHTNVPGSRHEKRWQDVEELLSAGIDVYTTVNVQHIESLNDIVGQVSGIRVRETIPDTIFEQADEVELVDLPPDELLERLRQGKVYVPEHATRALENFFTKGNLIALRELSLRRMAERVDIQVQSYKEEVGISEVLPVTERVVVCISASPSARRVVRAARRMAMSLRAEWVVAYVEPTGRLHLAEQTQETIASTLRFAEQLGAKTAVLHGPSVSEEILDYARRRNATKVVVGKPGRAWWRYRMFGSVVDELVRHSGEIDIYVISGTNEEEAAAPIARHLRPSSPARNYLSSLVVTAASTALASVLFSRLEPTNLVMIYLAGVVVVAARFGRGPSILSAVLSVMAFDFFFVFPRFTFAVTDTQYLVVFAFMLIVGLLISSLVVRVRQHAEMAREREQRVATLYRMSRELSLADGESQVVRIAEETIAELLGAEVWVLLPGPDGRLAQGTGVTSAFPLSQRELGVAEWVFKHGKMAGEGTSTLPGSGALYLPLIGSRGGVGVLGIFAPSGQESWTAEQRHLMEALASQMALVLERVALARDAQTAELASETEKLRNTVLSSLSHDLRTPLAVIAGASSSLLHDEAALDPATRRDLLESVWDESDRLNRLVGNLLSISRMEAGGLTPRRDWYPLEEVIGSTLRYLEKRLHGRRVEVRFPRELPLVHIDDVMIEQVLVNLVDNALRYAPGDSPIEIAADVSNGEVIVRVSDQGPGIPEGQEERIFDRFHRAGSDGVQGGIGLGLTICRGIIRAHGGRIWASNRERGGALIAFSLPAGEVPK